MRICIAIATFLQASGTLALSLFSFYGLTIKPNTDAYIEGVQHVKFDPSWLRTGRIGLILVLLGMILQGIVSYRVAG